MRKVIIKTSLSSESKVYQLENIEANTLGDLKQVMKNNGITFNMNDVVFFEAISRTTMEDNNSVLPKDIPYKGGITNDLAFMITTPTKKIANGANWDRKTMYKMIVENNLQQSIKDKYRKNYTMVSNDSLSAVIEHFLQKKKEAIIKEHSKTEENKDITKAVAKAIKLIDEAMDILKNCGVYTHVSESVFDEIYKHHCLYK